MKIAEKVLRARGYDDSQWGDFLNPDYEKLHDPLLLPDIEKATDRLLVAYEKQEKIVIYGDYDIDGLTSSALMLDAFKSFGYENIDIFIPSRFKEGYGLALSAVREIAEKGADLIITVDCGSLSHKEIKASNDLGVDVIVTDHHTVTEDLPPAIAVVNPKRTDSKYPFKELASVGVAFKLVQALQVAFSDRNKLINGQEKWLLDLVALGTVCDIVPLIDENRILAYWGLNVLKKTRRQGLKALMMVAGINIDEVSSRDLGFGLGPRMNASGRLETAKYALDMLLSDDKNEAYHLAEILDEMNQRRRHDQDWMYKQAIKQASEYDDDNVLVLYGKKWNHGIVGIVASKILEYYKKPSFVLEDNGEILKGSARSYGDFDLADFIHKNGDIIQKGGGHKMAAGVTVLPEYIDEFRKRVNEYYLESHNPLEQRRLLIPNSDIELELLNIELSIMEDISRLEPFGNNNQEPIFESRNLSVVNVRTMGKEDQHVKISAKSNGRVVNFIAFNISSDFMVQIGDLITVKYSLMRNVWQGRESIEGRLLHLERL